MKKALTTLLFLALCSFQVLAQQDEYLNANLLPNVTTPGVANLGKHISVPVSLNTGTPNISIPIYTLEYGGMQVPITLSYDASGVRVGEMAGSTGLKWNLNVGGVLTRIVKGGPDEGKVIGDGISPIQALGFYESYGLKNYAPYFDANYTNTFAMGITNTEFLQDLANGFRDAEPDLFSFNAMNHTSRFYFNDNREVVPYLNKDYQIKEYFGGSGIFSKWEVTSPDGILMTFGENDALEKSSSSTVNNYIYKYQTKSWFLNQLKNNSNNKTISFDYEKEQYSETSSYNTPVVSCINTDASGGLIDPSCPGINTSIGCTFFDNYSAPINYSESLIVTSRIKTITAGDFSVEFIASNRDDLYSTWVDTPKKIDEIIVYQGQNCIKKIQLEYGYFISTVESFAQPEPTRYGKSKKRLKLVKVKEVDCSNNTLKEYSFNYHEEYSLPPRTSFGQDKWGFYNGQDNNQTLFADKYNNCTSPKVAARDVDFTYARQGTLKNMVYPTGGSTEFVYESHVNDEVVNPANLIGWVAQTTVGGFGLGGGLPYKEYIINQQGDYKVDLTLYTGSSYPGSSSNNDGECLMDETELAFEITDLNTGSIIHSFTYDDLVTPTEVLAMKSYDPIFLTGNNFKIRTYYTYKSDGLQCMSSNAAVFESTSLPQPAEDYLVGGLRIKEINFKDTDNSVVKTNTYTYASPNLIDNAKYIYNLRWDINVSHGELIDIYNVNNTAEFFTMLQANMTFSAGDFDLVTTAQSQQQIDFMGSHISYEKVTEVNSEGKTEYIYYPAKTYFELSGFSSVDRYPFEPLLQSNKSGSLWQTRTYNDVNEKLTESINTYANTIDWANETKAMTVSRIGANNIYPEIFYSLYPEILTLQSTTTKQFFAGQEVSTTTDYFYEGNGHHQTTKTVTTNSLGEQIENRSLYAPDTNNTTLVAQNRIVPPVETSAYNGVQLLQKQKINYTTFGSLYLPNSVEVSKGTETPETRVLYEQYDTDGNLLQYRKADGSPVSFVWGYNDQYPIAKIENATYSQVSSQVANLQTTSNADDDRTIGVVGNEGALRTALTTLRNAVPNAMVTTYTYDPLIGVTSITDPKGYTTYYEYDAFNRLIQVKDADGKILSQNNYHYKDQQ